MLPVLKLTVDCHLIELMKNLSKKMDDCSFVIPCTLNLRVLFLCLLSQTHLEI